MIRALVAALALATGGCTASITTGGNSMWCQKTQFPVPRFNLTPVKFEEIAGPFEKGVCARFELAGRGQERSEQ